MTKTELMLAISAVRKILDNEAISKKDKENIRAKISDLEREIIFIEWGA